MNPKTRSIYTLSSARGIWLRQQLRSGIMTLPQARAQLQYWAWELEHPEPDADGWIARTNYERL